MEATSKISEGIEKAVINVIQERSKHYLENEAPNKHELTSLINSYGYRNAAISGGCSLVPGPWGMAAAVPEIILVIQNQLKMVYDIGKAHGHDEKTLDTQLLLEIVLSGTGNAGLTTATIVGQKLILTRAGARTIQRIIALLGGKVTQKLIKSMASKWIPVVGAAAMATWSKYSTEKIGKRADEMFKMTIEYQENTTETEIDIAPITPIGQPELEFEKLKILINLIKIDGVCEKREMDHINILINNANIDDEKKNKLVDNLGTSLRFDIDYSVFMGQDDEILYLLIDAIALAKIDTHFDASEKMFIKQIAKKLEFSETDLNELMKD